MYRGPWGHQRGLQYRPRSPMYCTFSDSIFSNPDRAQCECYWTCNGSLGFLLLENYSSLRASDDLARIRRNPIRKTTRIRDSSTHRWASLVWDSHSKNSASSSQFLARRTSSSTRECSHHTDSVWNAALTYIRALWYCRGTLSTRQGQWYTRRRLQFGPSQACCMASLPSLYTGTLCNLPLPKHRALPPNFPSRSSTNFSSHFLKSMWAFFKPQEWVQASLRSQHLCICDNRGQHCGTHRLLSPRSSSLHTSHIWGHLWVPSHLFEPQTPMQSEGFSLSDWHDIHQAGHSTLCTKRYLGFVDSKV